MMIFHEGDFRLKRKELHLTIVELFWVQCTKVGQHCHPLSIRIPNKRKEEKLVQHAQLTTTADIITVK
jgi:hypothetical protein